MGAKGDQVKGQAKEAIGNLTGDKELESEGKADSRVGKVKEALDTMSDKVEEVVDKAKDKLNRK